ncbi:MAG TPA: hypothetical protein VFG35_25055 [Actinoplanes sp.]|nr:hypothetical protein [Actinoplanes sp.]
MRTASFNSVLSCGNAGPIKVGHHCGPSPMDPVIALTAEAHGLPLAHVDADFDAIAKVRPGIAMVRIDQQNAPLSGTGDDRPRIDQGLRRRTADNATIGS